MNRLGGLGAKAKAAGQEHAMGELQGMTDEALGDNPIAAGAVGGALSGGDFSAKGLAQGAANGAMEAGLEEVKG